MAAIRKYAFGLILVILATVGVLLVNPATRCAAQKPATQATLEELLKQSKLDYTKTEGGIFKVVVTDNENTALVLADEVSLGDKGDIKIARIMCQVVTVPKGFTYPTAMLKKIAETNDAMLIGKLGIAGDAGVWYTSTFWLRNADSEILLNELALALYSVPEYRKELKPFVKEE